MSWIQADFWLGVPMKGIRVNPHFLRRAGLLFSFYGNPEEFALPLTVLFEAAGIIPEHSVLVGSFIEDASAKVTLVFMNKSFPLVGQSEKYPVEDAVVDQTKWDVALATMREAGGTLEERLKGKPVVAHE